MPSSVVTGAALVFRFLLFAGAESGLDDDAEGAVVLLDLRTTLDPVTSEDEDCRESPVFGTCDCAYTHLTLGPSLQTLGAAHRRILHLVGMCSAKHRLHENEIGAVRRRSNG